MFDNKQWRGHAPPDNFQGETVEALAFIFALMGIVAFVRVEKLIKTLKEKGILEEDYKEE